MIVFFLIDLSDENGNVCDDDGDDDDDVIHVLADKEYFKDTLKSKENNVLLSFSKTGDYFQLRLQYVICRWIFLELNN